MDRSNSMKKIYFYSWAKKYFEFSNFGLFPITINGNKYPTNEHYFQSVKFTDLAYQETIRLCATPKEAKLLGSSRKHPIQPNWDIVRLEVMETCVRAKFSQHDYLKNLLLETDDALLVEDSPNDYFWGCGKNKTGENHLGHILMKIRTELKNQSNGGFHNV